MKIEEGMKSIVPNFQSRIASLQAIMASGNLKGVVLTGRGALIYFGGVFCPWRSAFVLGQTGAPTLVTCRYDAARIKDLTFIAEVRGWDFSDPSDFTTKILSALGDHGISEGLLGAELDIAHSPGVLSAKELINLNKGLPRVSVENVLDKMNELMLIKDDYEIEQLRRAAEVTDVGMQTGFNSLRPGITEFSLAGIIENAMRNVGYLLSWGVTDLEVGSGYRQRYDEGFTVMPSCKIIQFGDLVTIDLHPMVESGYLGDFALNAVVGSPTDPIRRLADGWEEIVQVLVEALKPGRTVHDVACTVEKAVSRLKLEAYCVPMFGHGLGTDARIPPVVVKGNERMLKPRMVVEALVQVTNPSIGGMRLEVPVLLTESGNDVLCKTPLKLHVCK